MHAGNLLVTLGAIVGLTLIGTLGMWLLVKRRVRGRYVSLFVACVTALMVVVVATIAGGDFRLLWLAAAGSAGIAIYLGLWIRWPLSGGAWDRMEVNQRW